MILSNYQNIYFACQQLNTLTAWNGFQEFTNEAFDSHGDGQTERDIIPTEYLQSK